MALSKELKDKWIAALRSGKYKQTTRTLKERFSDGSFGYCCLGVLRSVQGHKPKAEERNRHGSIGDGDNAAYDEIKHVLGSEELFFDLVSMNDKGHTFSRIANYIEENC